MKALKVLWRKLTQTEALKKSSGELETLFFESTYRVAYLIGVSSVDRGWYLLYSGLVKTSIAILIFTEILYMLTESYDLDGIASSLNVTVIQFIAYYRYKNMLNNADFYRKLAMAMESPTFDITTGKRKEIVQYWSRVNENYLKLLLVMGNLTLMAWDLSKMLLLDDVEYNMIIGLKLGFHYRSSRLYAVTYIVLIVMFLYLFTYYRFSYLLLDDVEYNLIIGLKLGFNYRSPRLYALTYVVLVVMFLYLFTYYRFSYPLLDDVEYNMIIGLKLGFDYRSPQLYPLTYVVLVVVFAYVSHFVMVTDIRMQTHFLHLICQFDVLANCFENILEDCKTSFKGAANKLFNTETSLYSNKDFEEIYKKRLSDLVQQHKFLLKLGMELRMTLSGPMLGQLAASSVLISFIGYQAATTVTENITKCLMSLFFLGYNLFVFYIICRWCEEIKTQSENIRTAAYCSGWETGVAVIPSVRSALMLVIMRADKTLSIKAGGMYELSLMSYASIVKTSYTALTVLLRFRN